MTKNFVLTILVTLFLFPTASAQSWNEVKRNTTIYLYGEGVGATVEEADQYALADLISKISVVVNSNFSIEEEETSTNGKVEAQSTANLMVQTYATATLTNTERIVIDQSDDEYRIGRYIKRSELRRIFEGRLRTIKELIRLGNMAEGNHKVDDALRNYYWALALLKSVPHNNEILYEHEDDGTQIHPITWLPQRMTELFGRLSVEVTKNDGTFVDIMVLFDGTPVGSLDFTYFDGRNWSNISSVKSGRGSMEFEKNMVPEYVQLNYEYAYKGQAHLNPEVYSVLQNTPGFPIKGSRINITTGRAKVDKAEMLKVKKNGVITSPEKIKTYQQILTEVVEAIRTKRYEGVKHYFTPNGLNIFEQLIMYGKARVLDTKECMLYQFDDAVVARSIQMSFSFARGARKNFVEDVVFTFNADKKIDCIAFGLDQKAKEDILNKGAWTEHARQSIIEFLENYKTAYALKRIDYLRTIFDDDAVIIVGYVANRMVKSKGTDSQGSSFRNHEYVVRTQYSKEEYLRKLEKCFNSNEFVNIRFANNEIRRAKDGEEFGIQIKQDYYSTTYGDSGYLYLQVDLNDKERPIILVRTWQPEPDPEIGLFGLGDF